MRDVVVVLIFLGFTALCVAYVWWCDRIIGPDQAAPPVEGVADEPRPSEVVR